MDEFISANGFWLWLPLISISAQACSVEDILQMLLIQKGLGYAGSVCVCVCCSDETDVGHGAPARLAQTPHSVVFCFLTPLAWECSKLFLS